MRFEPVLTGDAYISVYKTLTEIRGDNSIISYHLFNTSRKKAMENNSKIYYHTPSTGEKVVIMSGEPLDGFKVVYSVNVSYSGYRISRKLLNYLGIFDFTPQTKIPVRLNLGVVANKNKRVKVVLLEVANS